MDTSEALDLTKENIQPLKQGRNPVQLGAALQAQTNIEMLQQLTKEREKFELEIRMYEGNDPLQPRYEYVAWLEQSYPKHGPESNLIPLLEDTLSTFKDDDRYKQDQRFVELLVKYIDTQPSPLELYQLVYSQGLGTMCALFYRAWADEFDKNNDMLRADQTYMLGIKNRAQPLDQLIEIHRQFQLSVGRRTLGYTDTYTEETDSYSREALSRIKSKKKVPSIRDANGAPGTWPLAPSNSVNHNQKAKAPVKVYQECSESENFLNAGVIVAGGVFPSHDALQKENCLKPGPWSGQSRRSKHVPKPATTPTFQVHEDEIENHPQRPGAVVPRALKPIKQETFTCPLAVFEPPDPTKKAMYCKHKVYVGGREFQFEELRAVEYLRRLEQQRLEKGLEPKPIATSVAPVDVFANQEFKEEPVDFSEASTIDVRPEDNFEHNPSEESKPDQNQAHAVHVDEMPTSMPEEPEPVQSVFPEKRHPIQKFGWKGLMDGNASLTANTKLAMNLVQEMWGSSSPIEVPLKQRRTPSTDKNADVFKVPAVPQPKILPFPLYTDEEPASKFTTSVPTEFENKADKNKFQKFSVFTDDDDLAQPNFLSTSKERQNKKLSACAVYTDDFEKDEFPCSSYGLPGDKTRKELDNIESGEFKKPVFQSKPLLGLLAEVIKPSDVNSESRRKSIDLHPNNCKGLVLENSSEQKCLYPSVTKENSALPVTSSMASKCFVFNDPANQVKEINSDKPFLFETPFLERNEVLARLISEQTPPQYQNKGISPRGLQVNALQTHIEDNDGDLTNLTCNTKAFAFALPSSTPMNGHFQSGSSHQVNTSYMVDELTQKAVLTAKCQELSKILEASNERGTSSSSSSNGAGGTQLSQDSEFNEVKQRLPQIPSEEIAEIEKSIGTITLTGDIDPFSSELISKMLAFVRYPKPYHLSGVHHMDKDLNSLSINSTVKLGSMKYVLQGEMGKGAYARVVKATKDDKPVALKYQKPSWVWELYIVQELQIRLRKIHSQMISGFMEINNAFIFRNSSVFETEWAAYGSLLHVVNTMKVKTNKVIQLNIVLIISIQLISIIEHLHKCRIIHGDVKPDNVVVTALPSLDSQQIFIKLIDFGRSIDMTLLPAGTTFTTVVTTDGFTCTEMLDKKPWTYQIDTYGLAGTLVLLLTGDYMKVVKRGQKWQATLPRYCAKNLWDPILSSLLNIESCEKQPDLGEFIKRLQTYLESVDHFSLKQQLNTFCNVLKGW